jgi:chemotaxis regulatin CheY-phosphate phosphatase CheZ
MTQEYIKQMALDTIMKQQAETKVNDDRDNLLYLMGFNDGVIELALNLRESTQAESEK